MESRDDFRFAFRHVERRAIGLGDARDEIHHQQREQPGPVPAEQSAVLRLDDLADVEAARGHQHAHHGEAHGDFVGDDLRRRAHRAQECVFGVGRPAGQDDAVHAHRGERQDVQQTRIDVGEGVFRRERNDRPDRERRESAPGTAPARNRNPFASAGITISLNISLTTSANGWREARHPQQIDAVRALARLHPADDLALRQRVERP